MTTYDTIKHIIEDRNHPNNNYHQQYWHKKLTNNGVVHQTIKQTDPSQHHIGDYYRKNGMKVDLNIRSSQATAILKVMNFIGNNLAKGEGMEDKSVDVAAKLFSDPQQASNCEIYEYGSELLQYKQIYGGKRKSRALFEMGLIEEMDIKAIAVSILAETNGSAKMATEILNVTGLKIIKQMNISELQHLKADLQSMSTQDDRNK